MTSFRHLHRPVVLSLCLGALVAPASVWAQRYVDLPGTQPGELARMGATPIDSAGPCGVTCHFSRDARMTTSTMPYDGWSGSMMGNTMRDPLFLATLTVADQDVPGVGDYCLRCHTPTGFLGGRTRGTPSASRGTELEPGDLDGVSCDNCHRMTATENLGNAQYVISYSDVRFGPYPVIDSMRHPGGVSTWLPDSRMCGTCHEVQNPLIHQRTMDGTDTGRPFPLDTNYSEWSRSAFAIPNTPDSKSCQDCHMPRNNMPGLVSTNDTAVQRMNPSRHDFSGANVWGIRALAFMRNDVMSGDFYDPEAVPFYENAARRAEAMVRSAATLELRESPREAAPGDRVNILVRVTNTTGHRLPTGYTDGRRMWLEVALLDADRRETVVSGAYNMTEAQLDTSDTQIKVYEALHGRAGMGFEEHIALHDTILKDNRIPPRGYRPLPGHEPVGADYSGGEGGTLRHWDDTRYNFTIPTGVRGPVAVRVRLRYQTTTRQYVEFLNHENHTDDRGRTLQRVWEATGRAAPVDMAQATADIALVAARPDASVRDASTDASVDGALDGGITINTAEGGCQCHAGGAPSTRGHASWLLAALGGLVLRARRRTRR